MVENEWRAENCPEYPELECYCPYTVPTCGNINCIDAALIVEEFFMYNDAQ